MIPYVFHSGSHGHSWGDVLSLFSCIVLFISIVLIYSFLKDRKHWDWMK